MLLGFISLLLVVLQSPVSQICIPERIAATWHPCSREQELAKYGKDYIDDGREGKVALVSAYGIHQLHIFIFVLAVFHILYCIITYALGKTKAHMPAGSEARFDFQKYIQRSLEEDFKAVVGISPVIWCIAVLFILTNTHGAKLQVIISKLGLRIQDKGDVVKGAPVVEPGDDLFWFGRPRFILFLIHLVLFTNAFQLAFFVWSTYEFTLKNCFHHKTVDIALRITMGVLIQVVCSYITLPLYALVTQMGTSMRPTIFNDRVANALKKWHKTAKKQSKHGTSGSNTPHSSRPATPTHGMSPMHLLHSHNRSLDYQTSFTASSSPPRFSDFGGHGHGHQHFFDPESQNVSPHLEIVESDISNSQHPHADIASQHQHADVTSPVKEEKETTEHVKIDLPEFTFKK
ncbi:hypothetical protein F2Q68_00001676 [Brassica cretica]|uniref:MLO-like protein n=1 Tax=Brassica cretica TaxID=69181 RepID=A0A8S9JKV9_BRACR|nr:hypothetical protein F2Q68_00001676 [Brassica cretica]